MTSPKYKPEELEETLIRYLKSDEDFFAECVKIKDHFTQLICPLVLNRSQRIIQAVMDKQKALKGYVKVWILKSRRVGASTLTEARFYKRTALQPNRNTFIVAHEEESTRTIYGMAKLMHEQNPFAPATRYSSAQELVFDTEKGTGLHSQYRMATARNADAGRSQGTHYIHGSEVAMWANPEDLMSGLMQTMPPPPAETEVVLESTAKGFGNYFQKGVFESYQEGRHPFYEEDGIAYAWWNPGTGTTRGSDFVLVFIPWFVHEIYTMPFQTHTEREAFEKQVVAPVFDKESLQWVKSRALILMERFGLTLEQLNWRSWCIVNQCQGSEKIFEQEYPSTVEEAFLSRGSNVYSRELCDQVEEGCVPPLVTGEIVERAGVPKIRPSPFGAFKLWKKPDPKMQTFITVDSAGGIKKSQEEKHRDPDPSCIDVWDHMSGEQCAQWHGHIDYDMIGELVERIGRLYAYHDDATDKDVLPIACVELNNHGYAVVADLKRMHYPLYEMHDGEPGWQTTAKTRPQMINDAARCCRDGDLQVKSKETVSEMRTFVEKPGGRQEAESGCHDERVMTLGMASQMIQEIPRYSKPIRKGADQVKMKGAARRRVIEDDGSYKEVKVR